MTLYQRLIAAFSASLLCSVLLGAVCLLQGSRLQGVVDGLTSKTIASVFSIGRVNGLAKDLRGKMRSHVVETDEAAKRKIEKELEELEAKLRNECQALEGNLSTDGQRAMFRDLGPRLQGFLDQWAGTKKVSQELDEKAMDRFLKEVMPRFKALQDGVDGLEKQLKDDVDLIVLGSVSETVSSRNWSFGLLALCLCVNLGMGLWTIGYTKKALTQSVEQLRGSASLISGNGAGIE